VNLRMICFECSAKLEIPKVELARSGWFAWLGGAMCKSCLDARKQRQQDDARADARSRVAVAR
jgi:hypothetical protein